MSPALLTPRQIVIGEVIYVHMPTTSIRRFGCQSRCDCGWSSRAESWIGHLAKQIDAALDGAA